MIAGFNWVDILIFALVVAGIGVGFSQGLLRQVIGLAGLYMGAILGAQYYSVVAGAVGFVFFSAPSRFVNAVAFFFILLVSSAIIEWLVQDVLQTTKLQLLPVLDQLGGAILGLVRPIIILTLALPVIQFATSEPWPFIEQTRFLVTSGLQTSRLLIVFEYFKPFILSAVGPWLPAGLPSLFNL
ncbi:MAG: CvpA family protein [Chloroflexi bacterium]|nr:CvpA family protein [Chloroflexota bacterium]